MFNTWKSEPQTEHRTHTTANMNSYTNKCTYLGRIYDLNK